MEDEATIDARIPKAKVPDALRALTAAGVDVFAVERSLASLEEVFLEVTGGETV
jgi:predicted Fe-Mo cluster-binding NifX family protein